MNKSPKYLLILFTLLSIYSLEAQKILQNSSSLIRFTENKNQWERFIKYRVQLDGGAIFIQNNRLTYHFYDKDKYRKRHMNYSGDTSDIKTSWFHVNFINANDNCLFESKNVAPDYNNYFIGSDKSKWASYVKNYREIILKELWNGVDLQMLGMENSLKYNLIVKPEANAANIKLHYEGVKNISIVNKNLLIQTSINEITENAPYAFQIIDGEKIEVPCRFKLKKNILSYEFPKGYNKKYELVIDPVLVFACSTGSTADNFGMTATFDNNGDLFSGGTAFNVGFPVTSGAYDQTYNGVVAYGRTDVVITKYDSSGTFLQYSTYLGGGNGSEIVTSLICDEQANLYLYGATGSNDMPITAGAYDNTFGGGTYVHFIFNGTYFDYGTDIYVAKLSSSGSQLLGCTYLGGSMNDGINTNNVVTTYSTPYGNITEYPPDSLQYNYGDQYRGEIQLDNSGNVYICSSSRSSDFPVVNGFDNTLGGKQDAVVIKFNNSLQQIIWSTFVGGSDNESGNAIVVDDSSTVYITGGTRSSDFPATGGSYSTSYNGGKGDGYVAKIKSDGTSLLAATYFGTSLYDQSYFIQSDKSNNLYILGQSEGNIPVINANYSNANGKIFITKLNNNLNSIIYSTIIGSGGNKPDLSPSAFLIDYCENIYFSGWGGNIIFLTPTYGMPLTPGTIQSTTDGYNFYLMSLEHNADSLRFASYFGGAQSHEHVDGGTSRFDKKGIIYQSVCAGCGGNDDFPVTPGAWPTSLYGTDWNQSSNCNNGTFKLNFEIPLVVAEFSTSTISGCSPLSVTLTNHSVGTHYLWDFGNGDTSSTVYNPSLTFTNPGTYTVNLVVVDSSRCNIADTASTIITVYPVPLNVSAIDSIPPCGNNVTFTNQSTISSGTLSYSWSFGDGSGSSLPSPSHTFANGTYTTTLIATSDYGCKDSISMPFQFTLVPDSVTGSGGYCANNTTQLQLNAYGGTSYTWSPPTGLSNTTIANPTASPSVTTTYSVAIHENDAYGNDCSSTDSITITVYPVPQAVATDTIVPCDNTVIFSDSSFISSGSISYNWDFGDSISSNTSSPTHLYDDGTYTAILQLTSDHGCVDTLSIPLQFGLSPDSVGPGGNYCGNNITPIQLFATGGTTYSWAPTAGLDNPNSATPLASPTVTTIYTVTISENDFAGNICSSTDTVSVIVYPTVTADFTYTTNACGNTLQFTDASTGNVANWFWDLGDGNLDSTQNTSNSYGTPNTYYITHAVTNSYGCTDTIQKPIVIGGFNPISISSSQIICSGQSAQLNASGGVSYSWSPSSSLSDPNIANPVATPTSTTVYTLNIATQDSAGHICSSLLHTAVTISAFSSSQLATTATPTTIHPGETSSLLANTPTSSSIVWTPSYALSSTTSHNPTASPMHTTTYYATAIDNHGCTHVLDSVTIWVITSGCDDGTVFVPNTFSPNGDGVNDVLYARSNYITDLYFAVYDRWGEKVFETTDVNIGWNGIYKGKKSDPGVFGYYLKYTCNNGEESFKKGNVTLIR